ncbi:MAG: hydroxyacid dehydrogenase, partial [Planctomycetes bacterium]|nr:hydroxyacid dehydrogenase [Planctomycetota bacterium]
MKQAVEAEHLASLRAGLPAGVEVTVGEVLERPGELDVLVCGVPSGDELDTCGRLRWLVVPYAGLPAATRALLLERPGLRAANLHHNAAVTAEMAVALLLAAAKAILPMDARLRRGHWSGRGRENPAVLLAARTAVVYGFGAVGRRVAAALAGLGMEVLGVRRRLEAPRVEDGFAVHPVSSLDDLLPRAAALIVCAPLTEETRGRIGAAEIARLPPRAVLVNVARGPVVSERALYEALRDRRLHSAGIDVWYRYPGKEGDPANTPPADHPFGDLDNVVLSPHRGGWLAEAEDLR